MKFARVAFAAAALAGVASASKRLELDLSADDTVDKNYPVTKVVNLLKDMKKTLEEEADQDEEIYEKMACWCKTNDREKTQAIKDAEEKLVMLQSKIEENLAASARLTAEIQALEKEVAANQVALDKATAIREKQLASFNEEEKDMLQSIGALKSAITVLSKHHGGALNQEDSKLIQQVLNHETKKHSDLLEGVYSPKDERVLSGFLQQAPRKLGFLQDSQAPSAGSYAPQSGEIFGILNQMKETFESNLSQAQKDELVNQQQYEELKAAKEDEIKAGQEQIDTKTTEEADASMTAANAKEEREDTEASLSADEKYLMNLKEKCKMTDEEWAERQKTRSDEMAAVAKAIEILSGDDARDTFSRTFNFIQMSSHTVRVSGSDIAKRKAVVSLIKKAADIAAAKISPEMSRKLNLAATRAKLDAFTKVKKAIDDMVAALLKEKEDEIKHRDFCIESFNTNDKEEAHHTRNRSDLEAKIGHLEQTIKIKATEIATLKTEIEELQTAMKRAGEDREAQNQEFQAVIADQRQTMKLLNQAVSVLEGVYAKSVLMQVSFSEAVAEAKKQGPPPPAGFDKYEKSAGGNPVIALLKQIIHDSKMMEQEAIHDETDAQKQYEDLVKETNMSIEAKNKAVVSAEGQKAAAEKEKIASETSLASEITELEMLSNEKADLHKSCDFVIKNFELRQDARDEEVEALRQAKAILSGANFDEAFAQIMK